MRKLIATCVMGIGLISFEHGAPLAAPKPTNPGAQVVFADRAGDAIRSDGRGAYVNDVGGATSQIYVNGSGDLTLNLFQTRPKRVFVGTFEAAGDVSQPSAVTPSGSFTDGWFLNIHSVWSIPVGATVATDASFSAGVGDFRWCGDGTAPAWCSGLTGSQQVSVTRTAFDTWTVVADSADGSAMPPIPGNDLNLLAQSGHPSVHVAGYYHMPFSLTITCLNSSCQ
jgi:hypothetical protein